MFNKIAIVVLVVVLLFAVLISAAATSALDFLANKVSSSGSSSSGTINGDENDNDYTDDDGVNDDSSVDSEDEFIIWKNFNGYYYGYSPASETNILTLWDVETEVWEPGLDINTDQPIIMPDSTASVKVTFISDEFRVPDLGYSYQTNVIGVLTDVKKADGIIFAYREMQEDGTWSNEWRLVDGTDFKIYVHAGYGNWIDFSGGGAVDWEPYGTDSTTIRIVYDSATCVNKPAGRIDLRAYKKSNVIVGGEEEL